MKQFLNKAKTGLITCGAALASAVALAEEAAGGGKTIDTNILTEYITEGKTSVVTILTAGAAIVGAFFIWRLLKKALNASK